MPDGVPGYYVVVAVQKDAAGRDRVGTPARASYQIVGPADAPTPTTMAATTVVPTTRPAPTTTPPPTTAAPGSTLAPLAAVPAAAGRERAEGLPAPATAVAGVLLVGVAVALRRQAPGR